MAQAKIKTKKDKDAYDKLKNDHKDKSVKELLKLETPAGLRDKLIHVMYLKERIDGTI